MGLVKLPPTNKAAENALGTSAVLRNTYYILYSAN